MVYFPIFEPYGIEEYKPDWPMITIQFEKKYRERRSLGFKVRSWKTQYLLLNTFAGRAITWRPLHLYSVGDYVYPTGSTTFVYMCAIGGVSSNTQPTWPTTQEQTVVDGAVTWVCFKDNQVSAVLDFIDARRGGVENFYVWIPLLSSFVKVTFEPDIPPLKTIEGGYYYATIFDVLFNEDF